MRGERWPREKGSVVTGSDKGSDFNSVSCELNPEPPSLVSEVTMELVGEAQEVVAPSGGRDAAQPSALVKAKCQPCSFPCNQPQGRTPCQSSLQLSERHTHRCGCYEKGQRSTWGASWK